MCDVAASGCLAEILEPRYIFRFIIKGLLTIKMLTGSNILGEYGDTRTYSVHYPVKKLSPLVSCMASHNSPPTLVADDSELSSELTEILCEITSEY